MSIEISEVPATMKKDGLANVRAEKVMVPRWEISYRLRSATTE